MSRYHDIQEQALNEIASCSSPEALTSLRVRYIGRSGVIADLFSKLASMPKEDRRQAGKALNALKSSITDAVAQKKIALAQSSGHKKQGALDLTLPGVSQVVGTAHPVTQTMEQICNIFQLLGFCIIETNEVETDYTNFQALNIPLDHSSADAFDTFFLEGQESVGKRPLLRSHTSPGQIHVMKAYQPPVAAIVPGKVYRPDATDASHATMFHQVEGFLVDKNIAFSDLKGVLSHFAKHFFGPKTKTRFRPHFFPFTEPSAEVDVSCILCGGTGVTTKKSCSMCKGSGWIEILGCGMIHPNVFKAVGYKKGAWTGFAFGMGVERIALLKHRIHDIRILLENDIRFLNQFA